MKALDKHTKSRYELFYNRLFQANTMDEVSEIIADNDELLDAIFIRYIGDLARKAQVSGKQHIHSLTIRISFELLLRTYMMPSTDDVAGQPPYRQTIATLIGMWLRGELQEGPKTVPNLITCFVELLPLLDETPNSEAEFQKLQAWTADWVAHAKTRISIHRRAEWIEVLRGFADYLIAVSSSDHVPGALGGAMARVGASVRTGLDR